MATVEKRNKKFRLIFYIAGQRYSGTLRTTERREADAIAGSVDRTLMLLEQGLIQLPDGADMVSFVLSGGKLTAKPSRNERRRALPCPGICLVEATGVDGFFVGRQGRLAALPESLATSVRKAPSEGRLPSVWSTINWLRPDWA